MQKPTVIIIFDSAAGADPAIRGYFIGEHGAARASYAMEVLRRDSAIGLGNGTDGPTFYVTHASALQGVLSALTSSHERAEVVQPQGSVQVPWFSPEQIRTLHRLLGTSGGFLEIETAIKQRTVLLERSERWLAEREAQLEGLALPLELLRGVVGASLTDNAGDVVRRAADMLGQRDAQIRTMVYSVDLLWGVMCDSPTDNTGAMVRCAAGMLADYKIAIERAKEIHGRRALECADAPANVLSALDGLLQDLGLLNDLRRDVGLLAGAAPSEVLRRASERVRAYAEVTRLAEVLRRDYGIVAKTPSGVVQAMIGVIDELEAAAKKASIPAGAYSQHIAAMVNPKLRANARKLAEEVNLVIKALHGKRTHENLDDDTFEPGLLSATVLAWERRMRGAVDTALISTQINGAAALAALAAPKY